MTAVAAAYTGLRPMGRGGATTSLAAWSEVLGSSVVIKQYHVADGLGADWDGMDDLLTELDAWYAIRSPALAAPIEAGITADGEVFVGRSFVPGQPLLNWARNQPRPSRNEVLSVLADAASGLAAIHRVGLAHGAVSPNNIIVTSDDAFRRAVLTDPYPGAIAEVAGRRQPHLHHTTPDSAHAATPAGDVAALASSAFELLIGHPVPPQVELALSQALVEDPDRRPSAASLSETLAAGAALPVPRSAARSETSVGNPVGISEATPAEPSAATLHAVDLAREMETLRGAVRVTGQRRRYGMWALAGGVALIGALGAGAGWALAERTTRATAPPSPIDNVTNLEIAVNDVVATTSPSSDAVDLALDVVVTNRRATALRCPGDPCRPALVLGRLGGDLDPAAPDTFDLAVDPRALGVETSPRRGSVSLMSLDVTGVDPLPLPRGGATASWRATATIPDGTEVLGVAVVDRSRRLIGFASADTWPTLLD